MVLVSTPSGFRTGAAATAHLPRRSSEQGIALSICRAGDDGEFQQPATSQGKQSRQRVEDCRLFGEQQASSKDNHWQDVAEAEKPPVDPAQRCHGQVGGIAACEAPSAQFKNCFNSTSL